MYKGKFVSAVICAAGASTRMKSSTSKQLLRIGEETVLERTVSAFENDGVTDEIVIVCPREYEREFRAMFEGRTTKPVKFAEGGSERQFSVRNGVGAADVRAELFAVHDGARPFVTSELIERVVADGLEYGCATLAVPVKDTIKRAKNGFAADTPPRDELYSIQTPQVFRKSDYLSAYARAEEAGEICTDDCRLIELNGGVVKLTPGDYTNIKITTPEDIIIAKGLAQRTAIKK